MIAWAQGLDPEIKPGSPVLQADSLPLSHQGSPAMCFIKGFLIESRVYEGRSKKCVHLFILEW